MAPESFKRLLQGAGRRLGRHEAESADILDVEEPRQGVEPRKQVAERDVVGAERYGGKRVRDGTVDPEREPEEIRRIRR